VNGHRWTGCVAAAVLAAGLTAGCSGDEPERAAPKATVLVPGRPGEPNKTMTVGPASPKPPNAADVTFVQMMIPHHRQAVEMSALAPRQGADPKVKALAERIDAAQTAEISSMQSWLKRHGHGTRGDHGGHGGHGRPAASPSHADMPGMASPEEMARLQDARGGEFDRLYLNLMIKHHEGALVMARKVLAEGADVQIQQMAKEIVTTQNAEIVRMRDLLRGLKE